MDSLLLLRRSKSCKKWILVCSEKRSFVPTWIIIFVTEEGSEARTSGILSRISAVVAPGKQRVKVDFNLM